MIEVLKYHLFNLISVLNYTRIYNNSRGDIDKKGKERKGKERKRKERKEGKERKGKERKGKERKGKERKGYLKQKIFVTISKCLSLNFSKITQNNTCDYQRIYCRTLKVYKL